MATARVQGRRLLVAPEAAQLKWRFPPAGSSCVRSRLDSTADSRASVSLVTPGGSRHIVLAVASTVQTK